MCYSQHSQESLAGWLPGCLAGWLAGWLAAGYPLESVRLPEFFRKRENHVRVFVDIFGGFMGPNMCICTHVHGNPEPTKP